MRITRRGITGLTAGLVIVAIYRAVKGEWSSLAIFSVFGGIGLVLAAVVGILIYFFTYRRIMTKLKKPASDKSATNAVEA